MAVTRLGFGTQGSYGTYLQGRDATPYFPGSSGYFANQTTGPYPGIGLAGDNWRASQGQPTLFSGYNGITGNNASIPRQLGAGPFGQPGALNPGGFDTLNNVKSGLFQNAINNNLGMLANTAFNPNVNPNVTRANTKNPALASALQGMIANSGNYQNPQDFQKSGQFQQGINQGFSQADADKQANRAQFSNFQQLFDSQTPAVTANVGQENNAISGWYNGGVQSALDANAAQQKAAVNLSAQRALGNLAKNQALLRMTHGDSSYANQQALDTAAGIYANEALTNSALNRENYLTVQNGQQALLGRRNAGNDYLSNRQLTPINYRTSMGAAEDARLGGLGQMDLSNNIYTTPSEQGAQRAQLLGQLSQLDNANTIYSTDNAQNDLARRIGLLSQLQGANNANNFYGLSKPYQPDTGAGGFASSSLNTNPGSRSNNLSPYTPNVYTPPNNLGNGGGYSQPNGLYGPNSPYEMYRQQTGYYPDQDPNFSDVAYASAQQRANAVNNGFAPTTANSGGAGGYADWRNNAGYNTQNYNPRQAPLYPSNSQIASLALGFPI